VGCLCGIASDEEKWEIGGGMGDGGKGWMGSAPRQGLQEFGKYTRL